VHLVGLYYTGVQFVIIWPVSEVNVYNK